MASDDMLNFLNDLVAKARKAGADAADALCVEGASISHARRLGKLEKLERAEQRGPGDLHGAELDLAAADAGERLDDPGVAGGGLFIHRQGALILRERLRIVLPVIVDRGDIGDQLGDEGVLGAIDLAADLERGLEGRGDLPVRLQQHHR